MHTKKIMIGLCELMRRNSTLITAATRLVFINNFTDPNCVFFFEVNENYQPSTSEMFKKEIIK